MLEQIAIAVFGVAAVWLSQSEELRQRRWAPVLGLLGQPFWFIATIKGQQWGMVAICVLYSWAWGRGLYNNWFRDK